MRAVEIIKPFSNNGVSFEQGHRYVMAENDEANMRTLYGENMGMSYPIDNIYREYKGQDLNGKKLLVFRTGGIGDLHWPIPVFKYLKNKYPNCFIRAASACKQPLENCPWIDELYDMPFDAKLLEESDYARMFQGIIEGESEASKKTHAVDMFFSYFGIDSIQFPDEEKRPKLFFTKTEMEWRDKELKRMNITDDIYFIGIQMETSAPIRNFPKEKFKAVIDALAKEENTKIALIGLPIHDVIASFYKGHYPNVLIWTKYTVRQTMVMATRYNLVISPDSFMVQTAGALEKPLIGIYGPFPSEVRMKYFKNAIGLDTDVVCSPCYHHDYRPCIKGNPSPCWSLIKVEDVLQAADYLKFKFTGQHFNYMANFLRMPDLAEVEKYMMSADKGICFFSGYYRHPNVTTVDTNPFVKADITNLSTDFKRSYYPFVLFMNDFTPKNKSVYDGAKGMVRPGGYFIVYRCESNEQLYSEIQKDVGNSFVIIYSKFNPTDRTFVIAGKKTY